MTTDDGLKGLTDAQLVALYSELRHTSKEFCGLPHPMKNWTEEHDAAIANAARAWLAANVHDSGDGEISHLRVVAKRNLKSYIERHITTDDLTKKTMLACLEELS